MALAAIVLFAPIARADMYDATHPYRNAANLAPDGTGIGTAGDHGNHGNNGGEHDCEANDHDDGDEDDHDDADAADVDTMKAHTSDEDHDDDDACDAGNPPGGQTPPDQGTTTSATPGASGYWLWVLFVALVAIAAGSAVVLRRRMTRNR